MTDTQGSLSLGGSKNNAIALLFGLIGDLDVIVSAADRGDEVIITDEMRARILESKASLKEVFEDEFPLKLLLDAVSNYVDEGVIVYAEPISGTKVRVESQLKYVISESEAVIFLSAAKRDNDLERKVSTASLYFKHDGQQTVYSLISEVKQKLVDEIDRRLSVSTDEMLSLP